LLESSVCGKANLPLRDAYARVLSPIFGSQAVRKFP